MSEGKSSEGATGDVLPDPDFKVFIDRIDMREWG